jgi:hypothetical protein
LYWSSLKLAHNLDVMHNEKNICENLIGILLKIVAKTKDTINARVDLKEMGVRLNLHMVATEDGESLLMVYMCIQFRLDLQVNKSSIIAKGPFFPQV